MKIIEINNIKFFCKVLTIILFYLLIEVGFCLHTFRAFGQPYLPYLPSFLNIYPPPSTYHSYPQNLAEKVSHLNPGGLKVAQLHSHSHNCHSNKVLEKVWNCEDRKLKRKNHRNNHRIRSNQQEVDGVVVGIVVAFVNVDNSIQSTLFIKNGYIITL